MVVVVVVDVIVEVAVVSAVAVGHGDNSELDSMQR